ncbi:MAG: hypothetical protein HY259_02995 [Chloroflexi bacterium]|nr:hypothetical protein [Chloroflexota bacterium]
MTVRPCRIVILTADTGGGHRSASEALAEALGDAGQTNVVVQDVFRYVPWPLNQVPQWYLPAITYAAKFWGGIYKLSDQAAVARLFARGLIGPVTRRGLARLFQKLSPDLVISAHPLFQHEAVKVLRRRRFVFASYPGSPICCTWVRRPRRTYSHHRSAGASRLRR